MSVSNYDEALGFVTAVGDNGGAQDTVELQMAQVYATLAVADQIGALVFFLQEVDNVR